MAYALILRVPVKERVKEIEPSVMQHRITLRKVVVHNPVVTALASKSLQPVALPLEKPTIKTEKQQKKKTTTMVKKRRTPVKKETIRLKTEDPIETHMKKVPEPVTTPSVRVNTATLKAQYIGDIKRQIRHHLIYPSLAKRMRIEGVITLSFTVFSNGTIGNIHVVDGSIVMLKNAAVKTLNQVTLKAIPKELQTQKLNLTLPISFKLLKGSPWN